MTNSGPVPLTFPDSPDGWGAWVGERCGGQLATARALVMAIKNTPPADTLVLLKTWDEVSVALNNAMSAASVVSQVHPVEAVRSQAEVAEHAGTPHSTDLGLDRDPCALLSAAARASPRDSPAVLPQPPPRHLLPRGG